MKDRRQTHGFSTPHIKSGDFIWLKFNLVIMRGGTPIFLTMGDLDSWWAITYNGGTFDNLISQQIKFFIGMHYRYQLLYVLNVINSFCISSMLHSIDQ